MLFVAGQCRFCCPDPAVILVFRFRSSHHFAAPSSANFGIKRTLAISIVSSAAYGFEVPTRDCRELIGTSNPPHWPAVVEQLRARSNLQAFQRGRERSETRSAASA